jgi:hypothetical membrane protein
MWAMSNGEWGMSLVPDRYYDVFPPPLYQSRLTVGLLLCGLAPPIVFSPFVIWAGMATPGYSHIASTFSDSAAQGKPHPEIIGTGFLLLGLLIALFAVGIYRTIPRYRTLMLISLLTCAVAIGATAFFQDYDRSPTVERNLEGFLHNAFAVTAIVAIASSIGLSGLAARNQPHWRHLSTPSVLFIFAAVVSGYLFQTGSDSYDGMFERLLTMVAMLWLVIMAANCIWVLYGAPDLRGRLEPVVVNQITPPPEIPAFTQVDEELVGE